MIKLLYKSEPLELKFELPLEQAVKSLSKKISKSFAPSIFKQQIVGNIDLKKIKVSRYQPFFHNSFSPILEANLIEKDEKTILIGVFRIPMITRVFLSLWLIIFTLIFVSSIIGASTLYDLLPILLFALLVFIFMAFAKRLFKKDKEWLIKQLYEIEFNS